MRLLLRVVFIAGHLSVLILFAVGLLGRFVNPHSAWWVQPFAIVLPALAAVIALLIPFAAGMRLWPLLAASAILLAVFGVRYLDAADGGDSLTGEALTVATFNAGGGATYLKGGDRGMGKLLTEASPHVACIQELWVGYSEGPGARTHAEVEAVIDSLGYEIVAPPPPDGHRGPPPIFSRVGFEESTVVGLSSGTEREPAGTIVRAQLRWQGQSFVVYNVHLQSFQTRRPWRNGNTFNIPAWITFIRGTSNAFIQRADEAQQIRGMLEREELPFLLCGDFNTTPHQWAYARLADGLQDVYRTSGGFWGPTYPARLPLFRIDFILASKHWNVGDAKVGPHLPPDHRPVIGSLAPAR